MIGKIMRKGFQDHSPKISLTVLGTLCFVTLVMCQTRFKITKQISQELYPPVLRSKDYWFLYSIGNPDRFKCVLKAFIVVTSPVLSLISTALLLFGKIESNPYFFIPWLFLTIKGLLLIQTDNIITMLRDMGNRENYVFGFRFEDMKWFLFYATIFTIDLIEAFSFVEIFDLFLVLWNHHPGYNAESATLEAVKKEIADIMEALSKCSLGSLSKISLSSTCESEDNLKKPPSRVKFSLKEDEKIYDENKPPESLLKTESPLKNSLEDFKNEIQSYTPNSPFEIVPTSETENSGRCQSGVLEDECLIRAPKLKVGHISKSDSKDITDKSDCFPLDPYNKDFTTGVI